MGVLRVLVLVVEILAYDGSLVAPHKICQRNVK